MGNRIKEQLSLFVDRMSAETMRANQVQLYLSSAVYVALSALRRMGLAKAELARAQATMIRLRLLQIGAQVRLTARRVWVQMAGRFPLQGLHWRVANQLRCREAAERDRIESGRSTKGAVSALLAGGARPQRARSAPPWRWSGLESPEASSTRGTSWEKASEPARTAPAGVQTGAQTMGL
jgi:hypothetical protein